MSTSRALRPLLTLSTAATLVACGHQAPTRQPESDNPAHVPAGASRDSIVDAPILADVPIGAGWDVVENAPNLNDVPIGAGWDVS
jgi:hypothetical protein